MTEITLIALKLAALIVGGVFAAIGLLTNYRREDGTVSKWGKIALFGIVLSTIVGAGTQGVESYLERQTALNNDAANRKSEERTQSILVEVKRALYPLRDIALEKLVVVYPTDGPLITAALNSLQFGPPWSPKDGFLPGMFYFEQRNENYPKKGILLRLIEPSLLVSFWRTSSTREYDKPDLRFSLETSDTTSSVRGRSLRVELGHLTIPDDRLVLAKKMASMEDLHDGYFLLQIGSRNRSIVMSKEELTEIYQTARIEKFTLSVSNHPIEIVLDSAGTDGLFGAFRGKALVTE